MDVGMGLVAASLKLVEKYPKRTRASKYGWSTSVDAPQLGAAEC